MDRSEYMSVDADYWYDRGEGDERAKIVAWLKSKSHHAGSRENELAEAIEAGEHLK